MKNATLQQVSEDIIINLLGDDMFHDMLGKLIEDYAEFSEDETEAIVSKVLQQLDVVS